MQDFLFCFHFHIVEKLVSNSIRAAPRFFLLAVYYYLIFIRCLSYGLRFDKMYVIIGFRGELLGNWDETEVSSYLYWSSIADV